MTTLPQEVNLTVGGISYRLSKFTLPLVQEYVEWCKSQLPDPFLGLAEKVRGLPLDLAKYVIDTAEARARERNSIHSAEIQGVANTIEGVKKIYSLLFRKYQPSLAEDEIIGIVERGVDEHGANFLSACFPDATATLNPTS